MDAEQSGGFLLFQRRAGFQVPNVRGQGWELDFGVQATEFVEYRAAELVEAEAASALPVHCPGNTALFSVYHFLQAWLAMGLGVFADLDADVAAVHFVSDCSGGAGT